MKRKVCIDLEAEEPSITNAECECVASGDEGGDDDDVVDEEGEGDNAGEEEEGNGDEGAEDGGDDVVQVGE